MPDDGPRHGAAVRRSSLGLAALLLALPGVAFLGAGGAEAAGLTYYVSASGRDTNNGLSPQAPWKTISRVNTQKLGPGDTVLFAGGATFAGNLYVPSGESGTSSSPITIGSYGTGSATISAGSGNAIYAYDAAGLSISNLVLNGSGASSNTGAGLNFYNDESGNTLLNYISVTNVTASGFRNGLALGGGNGGSGYSNVSVTSSTFHDNQLAGLLTYGPSFNSSSPTYVNQNVNVAYVTAYNNLGNAGLTGSSDSGNGIVLGSSEYSTIQRSVAYNNGASCRASACGVGIWAYNSTADTLAYNESYSNHTGSGADGDGFDLDQNTSNSILEYNYSHDNDGAGYLLCDPSTGTTNSGNIVRFNVSQNDGRKNSYPSIYVQGAVAGASIYNNTTYISPSASGGTPTNIKVTGIGSAATTIRNNIFYAAGGLWPVVVTVSPSTSLLQFQQNDYYNFNAYWGTTTYSSYASWQAATGQEQLNGNEIGSTANPDLNAAGGGGTITNVNQLAGLTQYQLAAGSPLKNTGLNLPALFGINIGSTDYFGMTVPGAGGLSVGAAE